MTRDTFEALGMPALTHGSNHTAYDEFTWRERKVATLKETHMAREEERGMEGGEGWRGGGREREETHLQRGREGGGGGGNSYVPFCAQNLK